MKSKVLLKASAVLAVLTVFSGALGVTKGASPQVQGKDDAKQEALAKRARITMEQARETALKRAHGTVESAELERERGKLVYSFDIKTGTNQITEVQVSAISGKIVRVQHENAAKEAAEKRKEKQASKKQ